MVVLAPHIGGATYDTEPTHHFTIAEDLVPAAGGCPTPEIVNPEVLDRR